MARIGYLIRPKSSETLEYKSVAPHCESQLSEEMIGYRTARRRARLWTTEHDSMSVDPLFQRWG